MRGRRDDMSVREAVHCAERALAELDIHSLPIDPLDIAARKGITVSAQSLDGCSGCPSRTSMTGPTKTRRPFVWRRMAATSIDRHALADFVRATFGIPTWVEAFEAEGDTAKADKASKMPRCWDDLQRLFESGQGAEHHRGTVWGAYNAVTEWVDHERGRSEDTRLASSWWGEGSKIRERASGAAAKLVTT